MNRQIFLESFGHIADAPGGVDQLRSLILDLAIRGQLGTQNEADEPADALLARISEKRARLITARVVRPATNLKPVAEAETFELPRGWSWTRFGNLFSRMGAGSTPTGGAKAYVEVGVMFLRSQNVRNKGLSLDGVARIPRPVHERMSGTWVQGGDILLNITGASIGRSAIVPTDGWTTANVNQHVSVLRPLLPETTEYLHALIISPYFQNLIAASSPGASREGLAIKRMEMFPVPLPPAVEQRRIAEGLNELLGLCDDLEQGQASRAELRSALTASALNRVVASSSAGSLRSSVRTFADNIGLHLAPGDGDLAALKRVRGAILDLAVRGRLTAEDTAAEPASALLGRMLAHRVNLVNAGQIRSPKKLPRVDLNEVAELPSGWAWVRFGDLFSRVGAGSTPAGGEKSYIDSGVMFLRSQNVHNAGLVLDGVARIPAAVHARMSGTEVLGGDILLNITGASIGRSAVVPTEGWTTANVNQHVSVLRPLAPETTAYLHLLIISPYFQQLIAESSPGASRDGLAIKRMVLFPVPIPPIAAQQLIVGRVHELMTLCNELEAQFAAAQALRCDVAASVAAHVVNGAPVPSTGADTPLVAAVGTLTR